MQRLKRRRDFLAAAQGRKAPRLAFLLETRRRDESGETRFGFTVTKRMAVKAVERNRIRRRLREAVRLLDPAVTLAGYDHVLVGRRSALGLDFRRLADDLHTALAQTYAGADRTEGPRGRE